MTQHDMILMIRCWCSSSFFWRWPGCNVTTRPLVMIWCLCVPDPSFHVDPAAMWQQDLWWWFWWFDVCVFLILLLMLTRLQCDNKTFGDDFDEFWWFDVCVPHPSFDVDPAAMWQQDLWWWVWWFDVCVLLMLLLMVFACVLHVWYFLKDSECQFGASLHQTGTPGCPFLTDTKLPPYRTLQIPSKRLFCL